MNNIFTEQVKSFKLIKPDSQRKIITYTKNQMGTLFLPIVTEEKDIFEAVKNLCGVDGAKKSFYRYYFPKRFIWQSTLYIKPRVIEFIDEKHKKQLVLNNLPGFRGIPRNKLFDKRNCILDYTDLIKLVIPNEKMLMTRPKVVEYIENIIPEIMCYILFFNKKHVDIVSDPEFNNEELKKEVEDRTNNDEEDSESREDMSFEEFHNTMWDKIKSDEAFVEKLFSNTKLFSMGGPIIGVDQYGFDKFVISFKMTLKTIKYFTRQFLSGQMQLQRFIKVNPDLIYQIAFYRFLYKAYEAYYTGNHSDNAFINELIGKEIAFHIWSESGIGFLINFNELKNVLKYKPERFLMKLGSALSILAFKNIGTLKDEDIAKFEDEEDNKEFTKLTKHFSLFKKDKEIKDKFFDNISSSVKNDFKLQTAVKAINESEEIPEEDEDELLEDKPSTKHISSKAIMFANNKELKECIDIADKFSNISNKNKDISINSDDKEEIRDVSFSMKELDDIMNSDTETDDSIVEDEPVIEENEEIIDNSEEDDIKINDIPNDDYRDEDEIDFESKYTFNDDETVELEDEEDDYEAIVPKGRKNGPIVIKKTEVQEVKLTKAEQKRLDMLKEKYKSVELHGETIDKIIGNSSNIGIEEHSSNDRETIRTKDPNATNLNLSDYSKSYVKNNYEADIINVVKSLSKDKDTPMYITSANVEDTSDQFNDKLTYKFTLKDENNKNHNITFDVPKLSEEGLMKINGAKKHLKKQLIRKPIVKIGPDQVYLTTQLNSYRVERYGSLINRGSEIVRRLINEYFVDNPGMVVERGSCLEDNKDYLTTLEYDTLARTYFILDINKNPKYGSHIQIIFSQKRIRKLIEELKINTGFKDNIIPDNILPVAIDLTKKVLYSVDMKSNSSVNSTIVSCIQEALHDDNMMEFIKKVKIPKRRICSRTEIQSKTVPLIIFLGYTFGWERVISYFPENHIEFSEKRMNLPNKLSIKFYDGYLYYDQYPFNGAMLLNGLTYIPTENYRYEDLTNQAIYINFLQDLKYYSRNIVKGWKTVKECMLDYKTLQILKELGLPTDLLEIFLYCNDLLVDNQVKNESDVTNYRIRGSEIVSECLYKALTDQYIAYKKKNGKKFTITMPKDAAISRLMKTEIFENYDCLSPIGEIKNSSLTTFKGPGGTKLDQAFTLKKRAYDRSYIGVFGMSTPDNKNAGIVKELVINPKIINTLGFIGEQDFKNLSTNDIATVEEALTPFVNKMDDPSRISFVSVQNSHVGGMIGASLPTVRTGVEKTVHMQTGEQFCKKAKMPGTITDINEITKKIFVTYKDGSKDCIDYNNQMLKNSDAFNEMFFTCGVKIGQKVKEGDILAADGRFFRKDPITGELIYTQAANAMVAIMEGGYTEDDSSLITESLSEKLKMNFTKRKQIAIKPTDLLIDYKNIGDKINLGDPLIVFDDSGVFEITQEESDELDDLFSDMDKDVLSEMIHQTPKSPQTGTILDIKVYWSVPINKMSPSIAKFVNNYINKVKKDIIEEEKFTGQPSEKRKMINVTDVRLSSSPRINGAEIDKDGGVVIEYFIGGDDIMSNGDKISLHSSLKSVDSIVVHRDEEPFAAESGNHIDAIFSFFSCENRMINSVFLAGTLGKLVHDFSKNWATEALQSVKKTVPPKQFDDMKNKIFKK